MIAAAIVVAFAIFAGRDNPTQQAYVDLYGLMAIMGVIVILAVQALVSVAILLYFWQNHGTEVHWWNTVLAPIISFVGQAFVLYLLFTNIDFVSGGLGFARWLGPIDVVIFAIGLVLAFYIRNSPAREVQDPWTPHPREPLVPKRCRQAACRQRPSPRCCAGRPVGVHGGRELLRRPPRASQ